MSIFRILLYIILKISLKRQIFYIRIKKIILLKGGEGSSKPLNTFKIPTYTKMPLKLSNHHQLTSRLQHLAGQTYTYRAILEKKILV